MAYSRPELEARVIRLEETAYFQDERLKALDEQLVAQQNTIAGLAHEIAVIRAALRAMREENAAREAIERACQLELPPHYQQEKL